MDTSCSSDLGIRLRRPNERSEDSEDENEPNSRPEITIGCSDIDDCPPRKPSRISIANDTTIFGEDDDSPSSHRESPMISPREEYIPLGFFSYTWQELTRGYSLDNDEKRYTDKRRKLYAFLAIPIQLERFLFYGQLQCVDAFFYLFTFLPIRFFMSIFGFLLRLKTWNSAETCDLLKVGIICFASLLMQQIDTSVVYHEVRSQGVIKLYIFYNMLEVADKLFSSLGQDILDALFLTANEKKTLRNIVQTGLHFLIAVVYATTHTFLVLLQATTLHVAFNSHTQSLLAIMMSNNFVELKGSVFKKFAKANLFQMACSDVRERFHIMTLLFVVIIRNMGAQNWSIEHFYDMLPDVCLVVGAEHVVDWFKHAFITKFNEINAEVYKDFTITLAFDVVRSRDDTAYSDYSDQVSRRMGFIPIPLSIMLIRILSQTFSINTASGILVCVSAWLLLVAIKICNGIIMLGQACEHVRSYKDLQTRAEYELFKKRMLEKKSKSAPSSPRMSLVDFTDVLHQPAGVKGFTISDVIDAIGQLGLNDVQQQATDRRSFDREREERPPRRTLSMANLTRTKRDNSEPPASIPEGDEKPKEEVAQKEDIVQSSPKKKLQPAPGIDCEDLSAVTAYTMLPPEQGVERIE